MLKSNNWILNYSHIVVLNIFSHGLNDLFEITIVHKMVPLSFTDNESLQTRVDRIVKNGLFIERAIVSSYCATLSQPNNVYNVSVELKPDVDGSFHYEIHFFNVFDGLIHNTFFAS